MIKVLSLCGYCHMDAFAPSQAAFLQPVQISNQISVFPDFVSFICTLTGMKAHFLSLCITANIITQWSVTSHAV